MTVGIAILGAGIFSKDGAFWWLVIADNSSDSFHLELALTLTCPYL
jgi:hypothetical protein